MKKVIKKNIGSDEELLMNAFEEMIERREIMGVSEKTIINYRQTFKQFCEYFEFDSATECGEITEKTMYQWINHLRKEGLANASINHYIRDIRTILYYMMEKEYIQPFKIKCIEHQEEQLKYFTEEQLDKLLEKPRKADGFGDWRMYVVICFILATGARPASVVSIKVEDVDFGRREIHIPHMKTKQALTVPMSNSLETTLREYIKMWRGDKEDYLFPNIGNEPMTVDALHSAFKRYCNKRDVERHNIYGLRHSFARGWIKNNGNPFALQKMLGHSDVAMTKKYVRLFAEDLKEGLESYTVLDTMKHKKSRTQTIKRGS